MIELTVGSRFWYKGKLCEVVINDRNQNHLCSKCVFQGTKKCKENKIKCISYDRHDSKYVLFMEVANE